MTINGNKTVKKSRFMREVGRHRADYLMVLPFALLFTFFAIIPIVSSIVLSFTDFDMVQIPLFNGFSNYIRMFLNDDVFPVCFRNTMIFAFITGPVSFALCFLFAWMINELGRRARTLMTFVFYAPSISGSLYVIFSWVFSGDMYGMVNSMLMELGMINEPVQWLSDTRYVLGVCILVQIWLSFGTGFLSFIAGLQGIDGQIYEAGAIDGIKSRLQELVYLTLPHMGPQLFFAAVMQIGASFSVGAVVTMLCGSPTTDYAADTIIMHIIDHGTGRFEMGYASAMAVVLFLMMVGTNQIVRRLISKFAST